IGYNCGYLLKRRKVLVVPGMPKLNLSRNVDTLRNDPKERRTLWADLEYHKVVVSGSLWILLGDFNVALNMEDSFSGSSRMNSTMISDHSLSVLKLSSLMHSKPKPFKFYNFLVHKEIFMEVVSSGWNIQIEGHNMLRVELDAVQRALDLDPSNNDLRDKEAAYLQAFDNAKMDEERFLRQKAKIDWLEVGDSNSAYFYKSIKNRNQRSCIDVITNADNVEVLGNAVLDVFVSHYHSFLGAATTCDDLDSEGLYNKKVSNLSSTNMTCPITDDEIKRAMFGIGVTNPQA
nr:hypothetical protein [Tanacetum cinerariifolium]